MQKYLSLVAAFLCAYFCFAGLEMNNFQLSLIGGIGCAWNWYNYRVIT